MHAKHNLCLLVLFCMMWNRCLKPLQTCFFFISNIFVLSVSETLETLKRGEENLSVNGHLDKFSKPYYSFSIQCSSSASFEEKYADRSVF